MVMDRSVSSDGWRTRSIREPTFTESLLMELLVDKVKAYSDRLARKMLKRAGFTDAEIKERFDGVE